MKRDTKYIKNLLALGCADGVIDERELNLLKELAAEAGISSEELENWIEYADEIILNIPESHEEREKQLIEMINISSSDGHFSQAEFDMCQLMADKLPYNGLKQAIHMRMNRAYLKNLVVLAGSDGVFHPEEILVLKEAARNAGVSDEELSRMIDNYRDYKYYIPESYEERGVQLLQMISLAVADGEFSSEEYKLCKMVAGKLDFTQEELDLIIKLSMRDKPAVQL